MSASYLRCSHCRGFYELALSHCRYCGKDVPIKNAAGSPKIFPARDTCRAIQIAEFEQLPPEAHKDSFCPDPQLLDKLCYCLHCGPEGGLFEAVEMRWMPNEDMWACPCTTCGGRGFTFDIHLVERLWQCVECDHWYTPTDDDYRRSNAECPGCGCREANGWFDDEEEYDEEEFAEEDAIAAEEGEIELGIPVDDTDPLPWEDEEANTLFDSAGPERLPDDIDFPRTRSEHGIRDADALNDDDIPY